MINPLSLEALKFEIARLREALQFYENSRHYCVTSKTVDGRTVEVPCAVLLDEGRVARDALAEPAGKPLIDWMTVTFISHKLELSETFKCSVDEVPLVGKPMRTEEEIKHSCRLVMGPANGLEAECWSAWEEALGEPPPDGLFFKHYMPFTESKWHMAHDGLVCDVLGEAPIKIE